MYFKPLIVNTGDKLEDIPAEMLRRLYNLGYLTVFGAKGKLKFKIFNYNKK